MNDFRLPIARRLLYVAVVLALGAVAVALIAGAAGPAAEAQAGPRAPHLSAVGSCDGLRSYLRRHGARSSPPIPAVGVGAAAAPLAEDAAAPGGTEQPTNVQEAGVDEPDIVKTAGSTLFTVDGHLLRAVDAAGDAPTLSDSVELPRKAGQGGRVADYQLLVAGDRLLAIGTSYGYGIAVDGGDVGVATDIAYPVQPTTVIAEIDVSNPAAMEITRTMAYDGSFVSARLTGSTVAPGELELPGRRPGRARATAAP